MSRYRKTYAAVVAAILATIPLVWDVAISQAEAITLVTVWSGVGAVYLWPNDPPVGEPADPNMSERGPAKKPAKKAAAAKKA